jgi:poly-gamma-glutamate capsule biosynthesis protein CapA/YwtB (metallophosphatase superfamily)
MFKNKKFRVFSVIIALVLALIFVSLNHFWTNLVTPKNKSNENSVIQSQTSNSEFSLVDKESLSSSKSISSQENNKTKILFVGDIMLARTIGENLKKDVDPFEFVKPTFEEYNMVFGNLETTIGNKNKPQKGKLYTFAAPPESAKFIKNSGLDGVSLANNHTLDYGQNGLLETIDILDQNEIKYFGAGKNKEEAFDYKVFSLNNQKIALFAINDIETTFTTNQIGPTNAWFDYQVLETNIKKAKQESNLVVVMPHWGIEYQLTQSSLQKQQAQKLLDFGVDLIVGNHPHVVQTLVKVDNKIVHYSLGNFVFDEMETQPNATKGQMLEVEISDGKIIAYKNINIQIELDGRPRIAK